MKQSITLRRWPTHLKKKVDPLACTDLISDKQNKEGEGESEQKRKLADVVGYMPPLIHAIDQKERWQIERSQKEEEEGEKKGNCKFVVVCG